MVPKPLHPSKIKALPESVGIEEGRGSGRDRRAQLHSSPPPGGESFSLYEAIKHEQLTRRYAN